MRWLGAVVSALLLGALLALLSVTVQGRHGRAAWGNMCPADERVDDMCWTTEALAGGWPWTYLTDSYDVSPVGSIRLFSLADRFDLLPFLGNVALYAAVVFAWRAWPPRERGAP